MAPLVSEGLWRFKRNLGPRRNIAMDESKADDLTKRVQELEQCCKELREELKKVKEELIERISQEELKEALSIPR